MMRGCGRGAALVSDLGSGAARGAGGVGNCCSRGAGGMTVCGDGVPIGAGGMGADGMGAGGRGGGDCALAAAVIAALTNAVRMALRIKPTLLIQLPPLAPSAEPPRQPPPSRLEDTRRSSRRAQ